MEVFRLEKRKKRKKSYKRDREGEKAKRRELR